MISEASLVGHSEHGFRTAGSGRCASRGQLDGGAHQGLVLLQLTFEALEEGEGIGDGAGEAGQDLAVIEAADLLGVAFS